MITDKSPVLMIKSLVAGADPAIGFRRPPPVSVSRDDECVEGVKKGYLPPQPTSGSGGAS